MKGQRRKRVITYISVVLMFGIFGLYRFGMQQTKQNGLYIFLSLALVFLASVINNLDFSGTEKRVREAVSCAVILLYPLLTVAFVWNYFPREGKVLWFLENALFLYILQGILLVILLRLKPVIYLNIGINLSLFTVFEVVYVFRKTPLVPTDIICVKTALSVAGNYRFQMTPRLVLAIAFSWCMAILIYRLPLADQIIREMKWKGKLAIRIVALVLTIACVAGVTSFQKTDFPFDAFDKERMNSNLGIVLSFYLNCDGTFLEEPEGYSKKKAISYLEEYPDDTMAVAAFQEDGKKALPNVIIIMDEAFSDLSILGELELTSDPLAYIHEFQKRDDVITGKLNVSVWGGNTCNSEFEMLTGNSMAFLPYGSIPYMQYVCNSTDSLCDYFHTLNYKTIAIHPYWGECWRRNRVYPQIGFDEFIDASQFDKDAKVEQLSSDTMHKGVDFGNLEYVRQYISDKESFRQVIHQFEKKKEGQKVFLFNVTMQNHGGYIYKGDNMDYTVRSNRLNSPQANQYLSILSKTDEAFQYLISYFESVDEPTIILFYGDHQPGLPKEVYEEMFGKKYEEFTLEDYQKRYTVLYYIWANYPLKKVSYDVTSANYLSMILKEAAGLPMDSWDYFRKDTAKEYPVLTSMFQVNAYGNLLPRGKVTQECLKRYSAIAYYRIKG